MSFWQDAEGVFNSCSAAETEALGRDLGRCLEEGAVLALCGVLGAGKTQFVRGLVAGVGYPGEISSPTFTVVHEYTGGRIPVYHFDFYRVESAGEVESVGWDDYLDAPGIVVVEWADKFPELFPPETKWVMIENVGEGTARRIVRRDSPPPPKGR